MSADHREGAPLPTETATETESELSKTFDIDPVSLAAYRRGFVDHLDQLADALDNAGRLALAIAPDHEDAIAGASAAAGRIRSWRAQVIAYYDVDTTVAVRTCRACGCTDLIGCEDGCSWVGADLCSSCAGLS